MNNSKGFTILEVLIAGAIMAAVALVVNEFMSRSRDQYADFQGKMLLTTDINQIFHGLSVDLANLARITDNGVEVESFKDTDKAYLGIYGFSADDALKLPGCHYEEVNGNNGYSILRFTTINHQRPAKLIKYWKEDADPQEDIIIGHTESLPNQVFSELVSADKATENLRTKEIIIIDGDGFTTTRLLVKNATYVESSTDPYDNIDKSPAEFKYFKVSANKPGTYYDPTTSQPLLAHQFITGSYVYSVSTKILCVAKDKTKLLMIDESDNTTRVLLNVAGEKASISNFRINYLSSSNLESSPSGLSIFPVVDDPDPFKNRKCIDQLLMRMDIKKDQKTLNYSQHIFVSNYNLKRPGSCK